MKKFLLFLISLSLTFILIIVSNIMFQNKKITMNSSLNNDNKVLSMMIETNASSGIYQESKDSVWPTTDYTFNSSLSKCENGSTLTWDNATKKVLMKGNISDKCYVYFDLVMGPTLNNVTLSSTSNSVTMNVSATSGSGNITEYYFSKDNGASYTKTNSASNTFNNLSPGTTYNIKVYVKDSNGKQSNVWSGSIATKNLTLADVCSSGTNLATCIKNFSDEGSVVTGLYLHNSSLENGANDNSYRYAGSNPNNYVCFGSTTKPCPADNLYRIIGVFNNQVKLIKYDYANSNLLGTDGDYNTSTYSGVSTYKGQHTTINRYYWNYSNGSSSLNNWNESRLNKTNLNTNYINKLGTAWTNKIATTTWKVGGNTWANIGTATAPNAYKNEIVTPAANTTYNAKIGLMYVSDYGYAAAPSAWTKALNTYNDAAVTAANWMYMGLYEWTISRRTDNTNGAFNVYYTGDVNRGNVSSNTFAVHPVFYLTSSVSYASGSGTQNDPILIN